ncbi:hypothetical protein P175DRAFT_0179692 [Aspergillus ochraceoroseus IBT 24754]|uniref:Uncharacterized protein n=1 Tax=Aspergillus ochraceoroseus IBT 24754 TaxID=1392256 RepID=A0A2T5LYE7_9EURO|nr:uncharacterized protein P175DRAFT_0179692 [Aspergillus ochraceoroseus IBT 24754]PTU21301.1 hypothetical protein P175DRAFT_0179692 [Aspergillus ochraceoroseus IBT 24754]
MDHSTNKMTMSRQCAPKEILKKELSSREYSLFEEWAPDTLKTYSASIPPPATQTEDHQRQTISPVNVQGYPNSPRRMQMRSSSLFEEWKALALRGTDKLKTGSISPFTPKDTNVMGGSCFAMEGKGSMRNYARDGENDEIGPTNERCPRYPGANKKCEGFSIGKSMRYIYQKGSNRLIPCPAD